MGIAVYCVNVTKKSVEKRVSMLTHRDGKENTNIKN